jgi:hypothetical protein
MLLQFSPRHPNASKAVSNWNGKCSYLHTEIYKYRTYIEALNHATNIKAKVYAEREQKKKLEGEDISEQLQLPDAKSPYGELKQAAGAEAVNVGSS